MVKVEFPSHMIDEDMDEQTNHVIIGVCYVSRSISWQELDEKVQRVLQVGSCLQRAPRLFSLK